MAFLTGGANHVEIFEVVDTGSGYQIQTGAGQKITLNEIEQSQIQYSEGKVTFTQLTDSKELYDFIKAYQSEAADVTPAEVRLEDGTLVRASLGSNAKYIVAVIYGAVQGSDRKVTIVYGQLTGSGNFTQQFNEFSKPSLEITGYKAEYDLILRSADGSTNHLNATLVNPTGEVKLPAGKKLVVEFLPKV